MNKLLLAVTLLVLATSAAAKHVYPQHLDIVANGEKYSLAIDYVFKEKAATFTVRAGEYVQTYRDSKASYLIGAPNCADMNVIPPKQPEFAYTKTFNCGIYLPDDPRKGAAFFFIRAKAEGIPSGGLIVDAIIKAGEGSFDFPTSKHDDALLRGQLTRMQL